MKQLRDMRCYTNPPPREMIDGLTKGMPSHGPMMDAIHSMLGESPEAVRGFMLGLDECSTLLAHVMTGEGRDIELAMTALAALYLTMAVDKRTIAARDMAPA